MNASNTPLPTCIDGISGADNIAQMWRDHYSDIFNSVNQTIDVVYNVDASTDFGDVVVLSEEVERAVRELVVNKSCGIDGIYAEHICYILLMFCFDCSPSVCLAFWFMVSCLMR